MSRPRAQPDHLLLMGVGENWFLGALEMVEVLTVHTSSCDARTCTRGCDPTGISFDLERTGAPSLGS